MITEAPPVEALSPIQAPAVEQALIAEDIAGYFAQEPRTDTTPARPGSVGFTLPTPLHTSYTLSYTPRREPRFGYGGVTARVQFYPNPAWARYRAKYPEGGTIYMDQVAIVTKFQNRIYRDSSMSHSNQTDVTSFRCSSGAAAIHLRYDGSSINEEFLRRYLEKYPSSL
jgi:hypothetical protein